MSFGCAYWEAKEANRRLTDDNSRLGHDNPRLTDDNSRLTDDNSQKDAEIRELRRQRDAVDEGGQLSQRRRLLLPGQTDYQDMSKIVAYRPEQTIIALSTISIPMSRTLT
ncbi:hypothetical protein E8E13_007488 [Curvularia kusanoi]|uniref:Uncharacterized protein n=1 Tax=Curvularia kusanoi TaxID=90978 RepID=A0A9P4TM78_CURKU|nr:hypothetical protein E8E13_007488 [Curvularia kusanoi]